MLYHTTDTRVVIYFRIFLRAPRSKKHVFVKLTLLFISRQAHYDKNNPIFCKYVQNKGNVGQGIFVDFAEISSLRLKLF